MVCLATGRVVEDVPDVHYAENTRSGQTGSFVLRHRGSRQVAIRDCPERQSRCIRKTITEFYCGLPRRNAIQSWKEQCRKRCPKGVAKKCSTITVAVNKTLKALRSSYIPEVPHNPGWLGNVQTLVVEWWIKIGHMISSEPSTTQLRAFACAILRWMGSDKGLVICGVQIIKPLPVCIQYAVSDLDVKRVVSIQCRNVFQMSRKIQQVIAGKNGMLDGFT